MKKSIFYLALTIGCVVLGSLSSCGNRDAEPDAMGVFEATEVVVSAKAQGEILVYDVHEGYEVHAGDTLGNIDVTQLTLRQQNLEDGLGVYDAHTQQFQLSSESTAQQILELNSQNGNLRQQIANLKHERDRFSSLAENGAASTKSVDDIDQQIAVLTEQLRALESQIASRNESLRLQSKALAMQSEASRRQSTTSAGSIDIVRQQINDAIILSPITGTILMSYAEKGEYAVPGKALFKVADLSQMTLRAYITAEQFDAIKLGQQVTVMVDNGSGQQRQYSGTITWIASKAEFTPKTIQTKDERANLVYAVKIGVKNDGKIKIGQYGEVIFSAKTATK